MMKALFLAFVLCVWFVVAAGMAELIDLICKNRKNK